MKVTKQGNEIVAFWWVGRTVKCNHCGQEATLEKGDQNACTWIEESKDAVQIGCGLCSTQIRVQRLQGGAL